MNFCLEYLKNGDAKVKKTRFLGQCYKNLVSCRKLRGIEAIREMVHLLCVQICSDSRCLVSSKFPGASNIVERCVVISLRTEQNKAKLFSGQSLMAYEKREFHECIHYLSIPPKKQR